MHVERTLFDSDIDRELVDANGEFFAASIHQCNISVKMADNNTVIKIEDMAVLKNEV